MTRRDLARMALALLCGAALALPAGFMLGRLGSSDGPPRAAGRDNAAVRNVFSPSIRADPYFLERQREGVEALERYCAETGRTCAEARAARARLAELAPDG